ncbi:MAG: hypothetical protein OXC03_03715 [Flavobacteriaceae bacterium]|nr:hypothetical protein [Flavobacteriaceae bacterium]
MRSIAIILFIVFGFTSIQGQYKKLHRSLNVFADRYVKGYKSGLDIKDCELQRVHWEGILDHMVPRITPYKSGRYR